MTNSYSACQALVHAPCSTLILIAQVKGLGHVKGG